MSVYPRISKRGVRNAALVVSGILIGALSATCTQTKSTNNAVVHEADALPRTLMPSPAFARAVKSGGGMTMADVAHKVVPSVVNISSTRVIKAPKLNPIFQDPMFRQFFHGRGMVQPGPRKQRSLGSGVIVSADGVVLTNNHVVHGAEEIKVHLSDGRDFEAKIVGTDPKSDLAVVRLKGKVSNLQPITMGTSGDMRLGDVVLAVGDPFGVGQTVTMGIVSAKGRSHMGIVDYEDFIQTDAAINPGNSGGALVNMRGELIGINTAILSRTGGYQGVGFAIPTDMAKPIMKALLKDGKVSRGYLGVGIQDVTPALANGLGLPVQKGVLISGVMDKSPAARAGLKRGDVIVELNGKPVDDSHVLRYRIAALGPGGHAKLAIIRDGKRRTMDVKLGSLDHSAIAAAGGVSKPEKGPLSGVQVSGIQPQLRRKFHIDDSVKSGVVVTKVSPASRAASAGIRAGDVILQLNRKPVHSVADFQRAYSASAHSVVLLIRRGAETVYIALS